MSIGSSYLESALKRVLSYKELGDKSFAQLNEADFHYCFNEASNSIAVIIQHMSGNMLSRFTNFMTEDGEKTWRNRDKEFIDQQFSKNELLELWEKGWNCFIGALHSLNEEDLEKNIYIRSELLTVIDAINRQLTHYAAHVGQIVYLARMLRGKEWKSLSIPVNQSGQFNTEMKEKHTAR